VGDQRTGAAVHGSEETTDLVLREHVGRRLGRSARSLARVHRVVEADVTNDPAAVACLRVAAKLAATARRVDSVEEG
jgi:hypothetical protein